VKVYTRKRSGGRRFTPKRGPPASLAGSSGGRFERVHHEAGEDARAANPAAGLAARRLATGDLDGARGARVLSSWHRSRIAVARAALREELVDTLAGENLTRYRRLDTPKGDEV